MEGSGVTYCDSKVTSPYGEDKCVAMSEGRKLEDGGSSSNSTVEEISNIKSSVRPYVRSKLPRLRWTPDLHLLFEQAVERLGGKDRATPKLVLQLMNIKGLDIAHVKSHLQMYRSKKVEEPNQGMIDHRLLEDRMNRNVYNTSQLPTLSSFHQRLQYYSNFRYGGNDSRNGNGKWMDDCTIGQGNICNKTIPGFYSSTLRDRISSSHCFRPKQVDFCPRIRSYEYSKDEFGSLQKQETWSCQSREPLIEFHSVKQSCNEPPRSSQQMIIRKDQMGFKREAEDSEVDLNLSLVLKSGDSKKRREESLLGTQSSLKQMKKMKQDFIAQKARFPSTLDLTL
ncbi:hypothetical protein F511_29035 [Dorcoceras hygrometricum]|uniref:HTH myb-type domain-containing protein n=1 Tax=Dorcoceras hygrometricum TaxID=472368 RepID=A0A2Z7CRE0_9LAMI|nr:hypothetical protein F511_29035 [Dorcoceras hygrometricum]